MIITIVLIVAAFVVGVVLEAKWDLSWKARKGWAKLIRKPRISPFTTPLTTNWTFVAGEHHDKALKAIRYAFTDCMEDEGRIKLKLLHADAVADALKEGDPCE